MSLHGVILCHSCSYCSSNNRHRQQNSRKNISSDLLSQLQFIVMISVAKEFTCQACCVTVPEGKKREQRSIWSNHCKETPHFFSQTRRKSLESDNCLFQVTDSFDSHWETVAILDDKRCVQEFLVTSEVSPIGLTWLYHKNQVVRSERDASFHSPFESTPDCISHLFICMLLMDQKSWSVMIYLEVADGSAAAKWKTLVEVVLLLGREPHLEKLTLSSFSFFGFTRCYFWLFLDDWLDGERMEWGFFTSSLLNCLTQVLSDFTFRLAAFDDNVVFDSVDLGWSKVVF